MKAWWQGHRSRLLQLWGVGIACSLLVTGASALHYLEFLQIPILDLMLSLQGQRFASEVVIVAIDEAAFESLGRRQPLSRQYLARLLRALQRSGAAVVGLDVALTSPTTPADDAALAKAILDFSHDGVSRVVLAETVGPESGPLSDPALLQAVVRGSPSVPVDDDGVIRRAVYALPRGMAPPEPAFSLAIAARLAGMDQMALEMAIRIPDGKVSLPMWGAGENWDLAGGSPITIRPGELWRVNFAGPARSFLTIPSDSVVSLDEPGAEIAWNNPLRDRIVLVGGTFRDSQELFQTPRGLLTGVEVHANLIHMLVTRRFIQASGWALSLGLQVAVCLLAGVALTALRPLAGTFLCVMVALLVGLPASYLVFHKLGYWVDFLLPVLAICFLGVVAEAIARRRLREAFGRYVSREVMSQVMSNPHSLRGERREVSILFSDLRGFTPLCEAMPVEAVAAHLNEYFDAMTEAIFARRGMINDFVGDAIMAVFGAPLSDPDHALHAVQSAVAMEQVLSALNQRWEAAGLSPLHMGIGIHSGEVFVGNVGGTVKLKYAVVGDPVNATARLESLNKELGTTILITEETRTPLDGRVEAKDRGEFVIKGRTRPLRVYELLAVHADSGLRDKGD
jgi:adenylate cyclase